ncbi:MAG: hypothetical protein QM534_08535 [Sediminibacterium sp.]|nr:hypothetical protein [Sediminibacterium sp.]
MKSTPDIQTAIPKVWNYLLSLAGNATTVRVKDYTNFDQLAKASGASAKSIEFLFSYTRSCMTFTNALVPTAIINLKKFKSKTDELLLPDKKTLKKMFDQPPVPRAKAEVKKATKKNTVTKVTGKTTKKNSVTPVPVKTPTVVPAPSPGIYPPKEPKPIKPKPDPIPEPRPRPKPKASDTKKPKRN